MKNSRVEVKREDNVFQLENWPTAELSAVTSSEFAVVEDNVTPITPVAGPVCKDGVCQLGEWKPKRNVA